MKEAAVDHVVESLAGVLEAHGILDQKSDCQSSLRCFSFGPIARLFKEVNAGHFVATTGEVQSIIAGAAAGVEDRASDLISHLDEGLLRFADVPGGLARIN